MRALRCPVVPLEGSDELLAPEASLLAAGLPAPGLVQVITDRAAAACRAMAAPARPSAGPVVEEDGSE